MTTPGFLKRVGIATDHGGFALKELRVPFSARQGVEDDNMNILCMGGLPVGPAVARDLIEAFLNPKFSGAERHLRRLGKVASLERQTACDRQGAWTASREAQQFAEKNFSRKLPGFCSLTGMSR